MAECALCICAAVDTGKDGTLNHQLPQVFSQHAYSGFRLPYA